MVLTKEYRICMPLTVEEYRIGQLYMIARHSLEQSGDGEGVEVIKNEPCEDPVHGKGQFTEKRIHLSNRLPYWIKSIIPKIFYVIEKAWNYYPFTITEYSCSFIPRFSISIQTKYENNSGTSENVFDLTPDQLANKLVDHIDIAYDEVSPKHYKEEEDPRYYKSQKTGRGPLVEGWRNTHTPVMCSYKLVNAYFEVFGLQTRVEDFVHSVIREVLLVGHRQAFGWMDEWIEMSMEDVRKYESLLQGVQKRTIKENPEKRKRERESRKHERKVAHEQKTNSLLQPKTDEIRTSSGSLNKSDPGSAPGTPAVTDSNPGTPSSPKSPAKKGYFGWF